MDLKDFKKTLLKELVLGSPSLFFFTLSKPEAEKIVPFRHQIQTLYHAMLTKPVRILIADEIGLGKTIQALAVARYLELKREVKKILVLVPKILGSQWEREIQRVGGKVYLIPSGQEVEDLITQETGYVIASVDLAKMIQHREKFIENKWDLIIADEVHNITINTQRYELLKDLIENNPEVNVIFLSATPHRGNVKDYLSRLCLLDHTLKQNFNLLDSSYLYREAKGVIVLRRTKEIVNALEEKTVFRKCSFKAVVVSLKDEEKNFLEELDSVLQELIKNAPENSPQALIAAIIRKRAASCYEAVVKTITKIISNRKVEGKDISEEIDQAVHKLFSMGYDDMELEDSTEFDDAVESVITKVSSFLSESQLAALKNLLERGAYLSERDSKLEAVSRIIVRHLRKGEKIILFTEFKDTLEYLRKRLPGLVNTECVFLYGGLSPEEINEKIANFKEKAKILISTDVASEGLNLQEASVLINYEAPWSPIKLEQRVGRIWRLKQRRDTTAYTIFLGAENEQYILESLYKRIMNISEALGVAPDLGVPHIFSGDFGKIWKVEASTFNQNFSMPTEYQLILSSIRKELDVHAKNIVATLSSIKDSTERVVPINEAKEIKKELVSALPEQDLDFKAAEDVLKRYLEKTLKERTWDVTSRLYNSVVGEKEKELEKRISFIVKGEKERSYIYKVNLQERKDFCFTSLVIYKENEGCVLFSSQALQWLADVLGKEVLVQSLIQEDRLQQINRRYKVKRIFDNLFCLHLKKVQGYDERLKKRGFKVKNLFKDWEIFAQEIATVEGVNERRFDLLKYVPSAILDILNLNENEVEIPDKSYLHVLERNFLPLDEIIETEKRAMEIVMELERQRGAEVVEDVSLKRHYDILVKAGDEEKYIEVKGHKPLILRAEVTEAEYRFAIKPENKEKYWIYIVANIGMNKPVIIKIHYPFDEKCSKIWVVNGDKDINITEHSKLNIKSSVRKVVCVE